MSEDMKTEELDLRQRAGNLSPMRPSLRAAR